LYSNLFFNRLKAPNPNRYPDIFNHLYNYTCRIYDKSDNVKSMMVYDLIFKFPTIGPRLQDNFLKAINIAVEGIAQATPENLDCSRADR